MAYFTDLRWVEGGWGWAPYRSLDMSWNAVGAGPSQSAVSDLNLEPITRVSKLPVP